MGWNDYSKSTAQVGGGGEWPEVPDDLYPASVLDVSEPTERVDIFSKTGEMKTDFFITFELGGEAEGAQLRYYVTLPPSFISDGYVNEKSKLYHVMEALGFDMTGEFGVDPREWMGLECRVMVENKPNDKGESRPRITDVKPARKATPKAAEKRQPVGAGGLRSRMGVED